MSQSTGAFSGGGEATKLAMLHDGPGHPVDLGIPTNSLVRDVDQDDLEVLVGRILSHPVAVEDAKTLEFATDTLLSREKPNTGN